jgi:alpha-tubulin suppressor-like RCC1 family protein
MTGVQRHPVRVGTADDWRAVDAGQTSVCGIRASGRLYCWGADGAGQLGDDPARRARSVPTEVAGRVTTWTSVSVGTSHACGRRTNGRLFCWGSDRHGQLGNGAATGARPVPVPVAGTARDWSSASAGMFHTCGRREGGRLSCWGRNLEGQIGDASSGPDRVRPVLLSATGWTGPAVVGAAFSCGGRAGGTVACWGSDAFGQLGNGPNGDTAAPALVDGVGTGATALTAGDLHACAIVASGQISCWGSNGVGQLGSDAPGGPSSVPTPVVGNQAWRQVSAGQDHTCSVTAGRRLFCWGANAAGQLGIGSFIPRNRPTEVGSNTAPV